MLCLFFLQIFIKYCDTSFKEHEIDVTDHGYEGFHGFGEPNEICDLNTGKSVKESKTISKQKKTIVGAKCTSILPAVVQNKIAGTLKKSKGKASQNKLKPMCENVTSSTLDFSSKVEMEARWPPFDTQ